MKRKTLITLIVSVIIIVIVLPFCFKIGKSLTSFSKKELKFKIPEDHKSEMLYTMSKHIKTKLQQNVYDELKHNVYVIVFKLSFCKSQVSFKTICNNIKLLMQGVQHFALLQLYIQNTLDACSHMFACSE